ncbi:xanthine dehydrogenase accessory protein XdhC [Aliagarivorans taiwanensis]|uniref:xanthine dehydrogenase accessory protein XdhC n=1 Tax=Aliagarivorans taiwanensis TaxID=561966 RepID=UPI00041E2C12|nr:xanthine dehydrogenase accessory protein XdhC [Aliagarivorans taiwanensis]
MYKPYDKQASSSKDWLAACQWLEQQGEAYCIATVVAEAGSLPRASGAKMVISHHHQFDTLGGGNLEYQVIESARAGLASADKQVALERYSLAADLGQCCGGATQVMFEYLNLDMPKVVVFGAGHVARALCPILQGLNCHLQVIDNRSDWLAPFSEQGIDTQLLDSAQSNSTEHVVAALSANSHLVIMTQDHGLDFDIAKAALACDCFPFVGLIGSRTKQQRFDYRLREQLTTPELAANLVCPIGKPDIRGKLPMQVAVSIAAQLMERFEQLAAPSVAENTVTANEECARQWKRSTALLKQLSKEASE